MDEPNDYRPFKPLPWHVAHLTCGHDRGSVVPLPSEHIRVDALWCNRCGRLVDVESRERIH